MFAIVLIKNVNIKNQNYEDSKGNILWLMAGLIPRHQCIFLFLIFQF